MVLCDHGILNLMLQPLMLLQKTYGAIKIRTEKKEMPNALYLMTLLL